MTTTLNEQEHVEYTKEGLEKMAEQLKDIPEDQRIGILLGVAEAVTR